MSRPPRATPALDALSTDEASAVLEQLLDDHAELVEEAEELAAALLTAIDRDAVADELVETMLAVPFTAIATRVGKQPFGGGYVEPGEAASEVLEETLEPFLDDLRRTAAAGFPDAALELGYALLAGLYRLRVVAGPDTLIGWADAEQEAWELATSVVLAFDDAGLEPPRDVVDALVPDWAGIA